MKDMDSASQSRGFTLIELLIVVAIIGILAAIAVPNFLNAQMRAKISRVLADEKAIETALEQYYLDFNSYVDDHDNDDNSQNGLNRLTTPVQYIATLPRDPFPSPFDVTVENLTFEFGSGYATKVGKRIWPNQAYLLISAGPNKGEEVSGNDDFPHGTTIRSFDISNGLKSAGDIVKLGGQWKKGNIIMDGRQIASGS